MTFGRFFCRIGLHAWLYAGRAIRKSSIAFFVRCERCQKDGVFHEEF